MLFLTFTNRLKQAMTDVTLDHNVLHRAMAQNWILLVIANINVNLTGSDS